MTNSLHINVEKITNGFVVHKRDADWDFDNREKDETKVHCVDLEGVTKEILKMLERDFKLIKGE